MGESSYKKLIVWQKAMKIVEIVYALTEKFPVAEQRNLKIDNS